MAEATQLQQQRNRRLAHQVASSPGIKTQRFGVDSGAAVTAIPRSTAADYPTAKDGAGASYLSATGQPIADEGQRSLLVEVAGVVRGIRARVTPVRRPLLSVYDLGATGHRVVFERNADGSPASTHPGLFRTRAPACPNPSARHGP